MEVAIRSLSMVFKTEIFTEQWRKELDVKSWETSE